VQRLDILLGDVLDGDKAHWSAVSPLRQ
jgi:hypothetical protein